MNRTGSSRSVWLFAGVLAAVVPLTAQTPAVSPFLSALDAIAQKQLRARADAIAGVKDTAGADARKKVVRERVLSLIGGLPEYGGPLRPRVTKTTPRDGYVIEHVMFDSLQDYVVTANLYRPDRPGRHPAILMSMGHWEAGKGAGQLLSMNLARRGFVVLAYDPAGQGERQQAFDPRVGRSLIGGPTDQHFSNGAAAILMGQAVSRYFIHDGMRALDYLVSRPEVDPERIGATGCSGGGTQTTYISALDPRIKVAAVACYMNSFQTLFSGSIGDSEQSVPGFLAAGLDQTDYVELFAPKPWLMTSTENDFFTLPGARQVFDEAQRWYELYDAKDHVKWVVGPGGHGTPKVVREAIYEWMDRWLANGSGKPMPEATDLLPDRALLVTSTGQVEGRDLYQIIRETPRVKSTAQELSKFVADLLAANPPVLKISRILTPAGAPARQPAVVLVQNGLDSEGDAEGLRSTGQVVAMMVMSGRGEDTERPYTGNWMNNTRAWLVGRNLPATHAAEINAVVDQLAQRSDVDPARITVRATGVAGVPALLAAAGNPRISSLVLTRTPHSLRAAIDSPIHTNLHDAVIPGFAVKWDLSDLRDLIGAKKVEWKDPTDWMGNVVALGPGYSYSSSDPNVSR
jgi:dienelactone hydrolase